MEDKVGDVVIYIDEHRNIHLGIINAVWSPGYVNLIHASGDEKKTDVYGRQVEHATSIPLYRGPQYAGGRCYKQLPKEATEALAVEFAWIKDNVQHHPVAT